jgi:parallel beta-helix repeat protein
VGDMSKKQIALLILLFHLLLICIIPQINSDKENESVHIFLNDTGSLSGYVRDKYMNPLEGAKIQVYFHGTYEKNYSEINGFYEVKNIPLCYCLKNVTVSKEGYNSVSASLSINEVTIHDFVLTPMGDTIYVGGDGPDNYTRIQDAIDTCDDGDIIVVFKGIYSENIHINKSIRLLGEDKHSTIIKGDGNCSVMVLESDSIIISGFSICDGSHGLEIFSKYCMITNNTVSQNKMSGIRLMQSRLTRIEGNYITENMRGITTYQSIYNTINNNIFERNDRALSLWSSSNNNTLSYNLFTMNYNDCISIYDSSHNKIMQNSITHNNYSIFLFQSSENMIINNSITFNNDVGILLEHSFDNIVCGNDISENRNGIYLFYSYSNNIINNTVHENNDVGIYLSIILDNSTIQYNQRILDQSQQYIVAPSFTTENNSIIGNLVSHNLKGIVLEDTTNITIQSNIIIHNTQNGVELIGAVNSSLSKNSICNNQIGIRMVDSIGCFINFQTFSDNIIHAFFISSTQTDWDSNYWDNWLVPLPKPIIGFAKKIFIYPSMQFDYSPLREPMIFSSCR